MHALRNQVLVVITIVVADVRSEVGKILGCFSAFTVAPPLELIHSAPYPLPIVIHVSPLTFPSLSISTFSSAFERLSLR